ncbi:MAG: transketolase [Spirochaetia bacterium]|nr:transketolase [Spirochaetia bacterium]
MSYSINELKRTAAALRLEVLEMVYDVKDGHPGPCFSVAEIITALYFGGILRIDPERPSMKERDRFFLSKGHACSMLYAALAYRGFFAKDELRTLRKIDSRLQGHPLMGKTPGNDATTGSLGNGLATAIGTAKGLQMQGLGAKVYTVLGDGETNEGIVWESIIAASHLGLANLIVFLDNNCWQSGGTVENISGLTSFYEKFNAFGWNTYEIDGHSFQEIISASEDAGKQKNKPSMIICSTTKGKGLSFMENDNSWHKRVPTEIQMKQAREILSQEAAE